MIILTKNLSKAGWTELTSEITRLIDAKHVTLDQVATEMGLKPHHLARLLMRQTSPSARVTQGLINWLAKHFEKPKAEPAPEDTNEKNIEKEFLAALSDKDRKRINQAFQELMKGPHAVEIKVEILAMTAIAMIEHQEKLEAQLRLIEQVLSNHSIALEMLKNIIMKKG